MTQATAAIALATLLTTAALAQTSTTAKKPVAHRSTTASSTAAKRATSTSTATAANPADNPPGVPRIAGIPKPLYALRYVDTVIGAGELSQPQKYYSVRYTGWLTDGTKFDSSDDHPGKEPFTFAYGGHRVIPGWDTGFEGMRIGGKRRLYIPYQLAYGEQGRPPVIPAKADLIFDLEFVAQSDAPPAAPTNPGANHTQPASPPTDPAKPAAPTDPVKPTAPPTDPTKPTSTSPAPSSNPTSPNSTSSQSTPAPPK